MGSEIKDEAEHALVNVGPSMSSANRVLLMRFAAQNALPSQAQSAGRVEDPLNVPLHVHIEVMLEDIAVISARLHRNEQAEPSPEKRAHLRVIIKAVRAIRFQFDIHNEGEVMAMVRLVNKLSRAVENGFPSAGHGERLGTPTCT